MIMKLFQNSPDTQDLDQDNIDRMIEFCEGMMGKLDQHVLLQTHVSFSDESTSTLHGPVNRQNCRYWSRENHHWMRELHTQRPEKINV